jgi:formate dehydrogenase maturation protein FdhE
VKTSGAPSSLAGAAFERRAARADALAAVTPAAEDPLRFAAGLYRAQGRVAAAVERLHAERPLSGVLEEDVARVAGDIAAVCDFAAEHGPSALAAEAQARGRDEPAVARSRLLTWWSGGRNSGEDYLSRAVLRPYVEVLSALRLSPDRLHRPGHCPFCGGAPWIAARRAASNGDGGRRVLGCGLCGGEWPVGRIRCPCCEEEDPNKLPSFQAQTHPAVRIEACESCRRYVKSLDLTLDARAIPEVDDLVSLAMDLWAAREGFTRIEPGLAGV